MSKKSVPKAKNKKRFLKMRDFDDLIVSGREKNLSKDVDKIVYQKAIK